MLTQDQLDTFHEQGYLVVPDVLDASELDPVRREYEEVLDVAARRLHARGDLSSEHAGLPFDERYAAVITECPEAYYYLAISLRLDYEDLEPHWIRVHTGPGIFGLITSPKILDVVESVLTADIAVNPVQQTRLKPPQRLLSGALAG